jgi:hypothetical protein
MKARTFGPKARMRPVTRNNRNPRPITEAMASWARSYWKTLEAMVKIL